MAKTAMVTGASGGIGLEIAERLAKEGYQLTLVARSEAKLKEHAARLGSGHRCLVADLSVPADIQRVAEDVRASRYDVLVNNAGIGVYGLFSELPLEPTRAMVRLNVDSVVELSHAFLAGAKSGDALLNVASTLALLAFPGAAVYSASKAFVCAFSEGLWYENKARGVYVAALLPGATKTSFHEAAGGAADAAPPASVTQAVGPVADAAMQALRQRSSPTVLTSFLNKAMVFMNTRMMPRKTMVNLMGGMSPVKSSKPGALSSASTVDR
ncbi:MAG: SDR family NAD(P)-dependent oxidoreductase [Myxococcota bacterium]